MSKHRQPSDASVLIAGIARNCARSLEPTLNGLLSATRRFARCETMIVESDSSDGTIGVLERLQNEKLRYRSLGALKSDIPLRTERIAHCRTILQSWIAEQHSDFDYVVLADLDGVNAAVTSTSIESCWKMRVPWDVATANQRGPYYDVWALRHSYWSPNDCWQAAKALEPIFGRSSARELAIRSRQQTLPSSSHPVGVASAFGGLGIYRMSAYLSGTYNGAEGGNPVCEHVPFHKTLRENGFQIYINPAMLNESPKEHLTDRNTGISETLRSASQFFSRLDNWFKR